jgi:hypothetical protein
MYREVWPPGWWTYSNRKLHSTKWSTDALRYIYIPLQKIKCTCNVAANWQVLIQKMKASGMHFLQLTCIGW